jgi:hypothetical protein
MSIRFLLSKNFLFRYQSFELFIIMIINYSLFFLKFINFNYLDQILPQSYYQNFLIILLGTYFTILVNLKNYVIIFEVYQADFLNSMERRYDGFTKFVIRLKKMDFINYCCYSYFYY